MNGVVVFAAITFGMILMWFVFMLYAITHEHKHYEPSEDEKAYARRLGYWAHMEGRDYRDNPYDDKILHHEWKMGMLKRECDVETERDN